MDFDEDDLALSQDGRPKSSRGAGMRPTTSGGMRPTTANRPTSRRGSGTITQSSNEPRLENMIYGSETKKNPKDFLRPIIIFGYFLYFASNIFELCKYCIRMHTLDNIYLS